MSGFFRPLERCQRPAAGTRDLQKMAVHSMHTLSDSSDEERACLEDFPRRRQTRCSERNPVKNVTWPGVNKKRALLVFSSISSLK